MQLAFNQDIFIKMFSDYSLKMFLNNLFTDVSSVYTACASRGYDDKKRFVLLKKEFHGSGLLSFLKKWQLIFSRGYSSKWIRVYMLPHSLVVYMHLVVEKH